MTALQLEALEARVLGVLIEKERTTPEGYPLSLNALVNGCNQKSNRDPVLSVGEREVNDVILKLRVAGLVEFVQLVGQRVEKYRHRAGTALHIEPAEAAVLAELLLRGSQQPGELRTRVERMHPLPTLEALQTVLDALAAKGLVVRHERRSGERAARWGQRLAPDAESPAAAIASSESGADASAPVAPHASPAATPVASHAVPATADAAGLEARVARLEAEVARLRAQLGSRSGER